MGYDELCFMCQGSGELLENRGDYERPDYTFSACTYCHGTGFSRSRRNYSGRIDPRSAMEKAIEAMEKYVRETGLDYRQNKNS